MIDMTEYFVKNFIPDECIYTKILGYKVSINTKYITHSNFVEVPYYRLNLWFKNKPSCINAYLKLKSKKLVVRNLALYNNKQIKMSFGYTKDNRKTIDFSIILEPIDCVNVV